MDIIIKSITKECEDALSLKNCPFQNYGRVIPSFDGKTFSYKIELFDKENITTDCFPDAGYSFDSMGEGFYGLAAYDDKICVGYAIFYKEMFSYLYLSDISVTTKYREMGVGSKLLNKGMELAKNAGKKGIRLVCQDNNPGAFEFYIKNGFVLGGVDTMSYYGTSQQGKKDLFLYKYI